MKKFFIATLTLLALLTLSACSGNNFIGTWQSFSTTDYQDKITISKTEITEGDQVAQYKISEDKKHLVLSYSGLNITLTTNLEKDKLVISNQDQGDGLVGTFYRVDSQEYKDQVKLMKKKQADEKKAEAAEEARKKVFKAKVDELNKKYLSALKDARKRVTDELTAQIKGNWYLDNSDKYVYTFMDGNKYTYIVTAALSRDDKDISYYVVLGNYILGVTEGKISQDITDKLEYKAGLDELSLSSDSTKTDLNDFQLLIDELNGASLDKVLDESYQRKQEYYIETDGNETHYFIGNTKTVTDWKMDMNFQKR